MSIDLLLGLQWGDEGKGKIVDVLTTNYDIIARFQGGPNAGHTLKFDGFSHVLHTIPSGIFHPTALNLIGNGVVIDPVIFQTEIEKLAPFNIDFPTRTYALQTEAPRSDSGRNVRVGATCRGPQPSLQANRTLPLLSGDWPNGV